jgi:hypothetical protein
MFALGHNILLFFDGMVSFPNCDERSEEAMPSGNSPIGSAFAWPKPTTVGEGRSSSEGGSEDELRRSYGETKSAYIFCILTKVCR